MSLPQPLPPRLPQSSSKLPLHALSHCNRRVLAHRRSQQRAKESKEMAIEVSVMMAVNMFVAAIALVTIIKLIPHNATQQEQLQSLEAEVTALDNRVDALRQEFEQYFDPQQTQVNKRKLSDRLTAGQRKIILTDPPKTDIEASSESSIEQSEANPGQ